MPPPLISAITLIVLLLSPTSAHAGIPYPALTGEIPSLAPILERTMPAVVNISTLTSEVVVSEEQPLFNDPVLRFLFKQPRPAPQERQSRSLGSGVIVDAEQGFVVTNHHVIEKAEQISVTLHDGRRVEAELIGSDDESDLAVIRLDADNLATLPIGDSDRLRVGDFVIAIGNPFGLNQTVTSGIVSALGRNDVGIEGYEDFIQTDASINPGNSGGALINLRGELVGINTAIIGPSGGNVGIGFAIPVNMIASIQQQLIRYGEVRRGRLGVYIQDLSPELVAALGLANVSGGAVVSQVISGSPAERSGVRPGDVITGVNEASVRNVADLRNDIGLYRPGERVRLELLRDGQRLSVNAVLAGQ